MSDRAALLDRLGPVTTELETTDPDAALTDLRPLAASVDDAAIVGLGEATHGSRECFELKHRLVRYLVEERGWRSFAIEANFSEALAVDDYVVRGEGDPREALDGMYFWTINTEEVLAMVEWMRGFNENRPVDDRVRFYGFDLQFTQGPAEALREFLADVDPEFLREVEARLVPLESEESNGERTPIDPEYLDGTESLLGTLDDRFDSRAGEYADASSPERVELARQHRRTLEQTYEIAAEVHAAEDPREAQGLRDEFMAENVAWIREHGPGDSVALWAHNGHVLKGATRGSWTQFDPMGGHLADRFGDDYHALGFEFGGGTFQAFPHPEADADGGLQEWSTPPLADQLPLGLGGASDEDDGESEASRDERESADDDSGPVDAPVQLQEAMQALDGDPLFVDVGAARDDDRLGPWLDDYHTCHHIGAVFHDEDDRTEFFTRYRLGRELDSLLFVRETTRAQPVERDD
jgi:erythromycin esterase